MKKKCLLVVLFSSVALVAVLGGAIGWSFHTHTDGSPRDKDDDCMVCRLGSILAGVIVVAAFLLQLLFFILARLVPLSPDKVTTKEFLGCCLARAPPASL